MRFITVKSALRSFKAPSPANSPARAGGLAKRGSLRLLFAHGYKLFAGGAVGVACFCKGLELLLKAVCQVRGVKEPSGYHKIFEMFQQIEGCKRFRGNCETLFELKEYESAMTEASETVEKLHKSWMHARYAALKEGTFEVPKPEKAKLLVYAIIVTYFADFASDTQRLLNLDIDVVLQQT